MQIVLIVAGAVAVLLLLVVVLSRRSSRRRRGISHSDMEARQAFFRAVSEKDSEES